MNIRKIVKFIPLVFTLINLSPQVKAIEFDTNGTKKNQQNKNIIYSKKVFPHNREVLEHNSYKKYKDNYLNNSKGKDINTVRNFSPLLTANFSNSKKELEIQSEIQSEENNILNAEGNVLVSYKGNILKADSITYDKTNKIIIA